MRVRMLTTAKGGGGGGSESPACRGDRSTSPLARVAGSARAATQQAGCPDRWRTCRQVAGSQPAVSRQLQVPAATMAGAGAPIRSGCTVFSLDRRRESQEALEEDGELRRAAKTTVSKGGRDAGSAHVM